MKENPFVVLRRRLGVDRKTLAFALGLSGGTLYFYENGRALKISANILKKLKSIGVDTDQFENQYSEWREEVSKSALEKIKLKNFFQEEEEEEGILELLSNAPSIIKLRGGREPTPAPSRKSEA